MPNVRLRTIINVDNSTTFQVQREDGEWVDLTWQMITDKPFETLDDTIFTVDENGVLSIISLSTPDWQNIVNKPFITLDPSDFTVDNNGVLHYSGSMDWTSLTGKPFSSLDSDDFTVDNNGKLSVIHQNIPNQNWSQITGKPFTSLNNQQFQVIGGTLYLNVATNPQWVNVQNKPFSTLDPNNFTVDNGMLKAIPQTIPDQNWSQIQQKPFESLDANDFTVDADGKMSVNFPTPTPDDWQDVSSKPFETLNGTDFSVDQDGELSVNFPTPTPDDWDSITSKPFETLNSSDFSVDPDTGELSLAGGGGGGNPEWSDVLNKPFTYLGNYVYQYDDKLNVRGTSVVVQDNRGPDLDTEAKLKSCIMDILGASLDNYLGLTPSQNNYMLLNSIVNICKTHCRAKSGINTWDFYPVIIASLNKIYESSSLDRFMIGFQAYGAPKTSVASTDDTRMICGEVIFSVSKTNGSYTGNASYYNYQIYTADVAKGYFT